MSYLVYLSLGTNLGDRQVNLQAALAALPVRVEVQAVSPVYQTPPWGYADQPHFLNQVLSAYTELSPLELLHYLKELEIRLGRQPNFRYGPRLIDLDILLYNEWILQNSELIIPHPHLHTRAFVLAPLADLAPDLVHPVLCKTVRELKAEVDCSKIEFYLGKA